MLMGTCNLMGTLDIDIGDYENQLNAWNRQDMLDYQIKVDYFESSGTGEIVIFNVKNGVPGIRYSEYHFKNKGTIPEIYSFIKEEEKRIRDRNKNSIDDMYRLKVSYNTEYHYPNKIETSVTHISQLGSVGNGSEESWKITLTPLGETEQETGSGEE
jgi:hypothetical protein